MHKEVSIKVGSQCISLWKKPWAKRLARVTLFVDFNDHFVVIRDPSKGIWFLPGGGVEQNESIEETAKREAIEELGVEIRVIRTLKTFHITLISKETGEKLKIPTFVAVYATSTGGQPRSAYAPNRKISLIKKNEYDTLLQDFKIPKEYEGWKPYIYVSKEIIREFFWSSVESIG